MKKEFIYDMQNAYSTYNLNEDGDLPEKVLSYLFDRINANRKEIEKLISMYKIKLTIEDILNIVREETSKKNAYLGKTIIDRQGFMLAQVLVPVGLVVVRAYNPLQIIRYWIKAIKTRNAVAVVTNKYSEYSLEALVLVIIKEALSKFNLSSNLVMYVSEEECKYELFDEIIYTCSKDGELYKNPEVQDMMRLSSNADKKYVYMEDEEFKSEAVQNKDVTILTGSFEKVINRIKNAKGAVIYTKSSEKAYRFINEACCENVFVNTNLQNAFETVECADEMYRYKNIIIPVPKEVLLSKKEKSEESSDSTIQSNKNDTNNMMIEYKESLWKKIKNRFKELFNK